MKYFMAMLAVVLFVTTANCESVLPEDQAVATYEEKTFTISAGLGFMSGETTYRIGGHITTPDGTSTTRFPISELAFPLELYYGRIGGEIRLFDRLELKTTIKKSITNGSGEMRDSDWGQLYNDDDYPDWDDPNSLDTYSESKIDADMFMADLSVRYYVYEMTFRKWGVSFFAGAKYLYDKFNFTASDANQWYPSLNEYYGYDYRHDYLFGDILTYEVTQKIPAVTGGVALIGSPVFILDMEFGYSPKAEVENEDIHILRKKIAYAECDGTAFLFSITGNCRLENHWSLGLKYDYLWVDTDGEQRQEYLNGEYIGTIEQTNFSEVHTFELALSFLF
jgi:outer membrane protease